MGVQIFILARRWLFGCDDRINTVLTGFRGRTGRTLASNIRGSKRTPCARTTVSVENRLLGDRGIKNFYPAGNFVGCMGKEEFDDYERRKRLYRSAFEDYNSLKTTYLKFYTASDQLKRRGRVLTYGSTVSGGILLFIIGTVLVRDGPAWSTDLAFGLSMVVAALSFVNAVDNPQKLSNVCYNSGQTLQRVFYDFHYFVTVRLPDPDEDLDVLEEEYERLLERKHTVNETTPHLGEKWFHRAKEERKSWEPKPLWEITGENEEFAVEGEEKQAGVPFRIKQSIVSPIRNAIRWLGY